MWSKIKNSIFGKKEQSPKELIVLAIREMEQALARHKKASQQAVQREQEIAQKLLEATKELGAWKISVAQAIKAKKELEAKRLLAKEDLLQQRSKHFQALHQQALQTVQALERQQQQLVLKLEETKSKQVMLTAQLDGAQSQQDLQHFLENLDSSGLWQDMDSTLTSLTDDDADIWDKEIDAALGDQLEQERLNKIQQEIEAEERVKVKEVEAKKLQKASGFFARGTTPVKALSKKQQEDKRQKLQEFLNSQTTKVDDESKKNLLEAFAKATEEPHPDNTPNTTLTNEQQQLFNQFMQQAPPSPKEDNWAAKALKELSSQSPKKEKPIDSKAQSKIDDFFKD